MGVYLPLASVKRKKSQIFLIECNIYFHYNLSFSLVEVLVSNWFSEHFCAIKLPYIFRYCGSHGFLWNVHPLFDLTILLYIFHSHETFKKYFRSSISSKLISYSGMLQTKFSAFLNMNQTWKMELRKYA